MGKVEDNPRDDDRHAGNWGAQGKHLVDATEDGEPEAKGGERVVAVQPAEGEGVNPRAAQLPMFGDPYGGKGVA